MTSQVHSVQVNIEESNFLNGEADGCGSLMGASRHLSRKDVKRPISTLKRRRLGMYQNMTETFYVYM